MYHYLFIFKIKLASCILQLWKLRRSGRKWIEKAGTAHATCSFSTFELKSKLVSVLVRFTMPPKRRVSGKKRPKVFSGTPYHLVKARAENSGQKQQSESDEEEYARPSASKRKLTVNIGVTSGTSTVLLRPRIGNASNSMLDSQSSEPGSSGVSDSPGNHIINWRELEEFVKEVRHCRRQPLTISENSSSRRGLVTSITVSCGCGWFHKLTDPYDSRQLTLNAKAVFGMKLIGKGQKSLSTLCAMMDLLPGVGPSSFSAHVSKLLVSSNELVRTDQLASVHELCGLSGSGKLFVPPPMVHDDSNSKEEANDETTGSDNDELEESWSESDDMGLEVDEVDSDQDDDSDSQNHDDQSDSDLGDPTIGEVPPTIWITEPLDITVTFDGTWSKRGSTALYGVFVVMSWDTGRVLDTHVMSKHCIKCTRKQRSLALNDTDIVSSDEFQAWYSWHEHECTLNHSGSSSAMEVGGAIVLWKRSIERLNLRYVNVISDGDSKAISSVQKAKPYGDDCPVVKYECVGHVQKRVGAAIIKLRQNPPTEMVEEVVEKAVKATKKRPTVAAKPTVTKMVARKVRIGGVGGITETKYKTLQRYYGKAIREHAGDLEGMIDACWAVYYHTISTDANPQHNKCPKGADSWCKYQQSLALKVTPPEHLRDDDPKRLIPLRLAQYVKPIFERLCSRKLLARCVLGATQNQNESFNKLVWQRCPKTDFTSVNTVQIAVNLAIISFNRGAKSFVTLAEHMGLMPGSTCHEYFHKQDVFRIKRAEKLQLAGERRRRKENKRHKVAAEEQKHAAEGTTYQSGGF